MTQTQPMPRNYRCPFCQEVQAADPQPDQKIFVLCATCGGRFQIGALKGPARRQTSHQQAKVREQVKRQADAQRSPDQQSKLDRIVAQKRLGDYDILDELGRGGMGVVFKAHHRHLKRMVALKVVLPDAEDQVMMLKRFKREAALHARLSHPSIVHVYDYGVIDTIHYFAMDFIAGVQLTKLIGSPEFKLEKRIAVMQEIADALDHAHQAGVVHRDIKPDNIIVDDGWRAHLVDFGIAKPTDTDGMENITRQGLAIGTPHYMAPEQFRKKIGEVGPKSDVYSVGGVLYHALAGRPPFEDDTPHGVLIKAATQTAAPLAGTRTPSDELIHSDLEAIVVRCLEKLPENRYESASQLASDLERHLLGEEVLARPLGGMERARRTLKRNRHTVGLFAMVASVLVVIIAAFLVTLLGMRSSNEQLGAAIGDAQTRLGHISERPDPEVQTWASEATSALAGTGAILKDSRRRVLLTALISSSTAAALVLIFGYLLVIRPLTRRTKLVVSHETMPEDISTTADEV
ncbi:MAG: serine/threonine protein kinase [Myxococcota bacterium]|jgi:serine/threonine protein kinase